MADTIRRSISFSKNAVDRLERMKKHTDAASESEVLRNALRLYEWVIDETHKGSEVYISDDGGKTVVRVPILVAA